MFFQQKKKKEALQSRRVVSALKINLVENFFK